MTDTLHVTPISEVGFSAAVAREGGQARVLIAGNADSSVRGALDGFLGEVHAEVVRTLAQSVTVDLRELEFMNSSCFKSLLTWVGRIQQLEEGKRYNIKFLSDSEKYWQRRSLHALRCFATDLIDVEG